MRHIIVFPYYCQEEVESFLELLDLDPLWTDNATQYQFLLVSRYDFSLSEELESRCSSLAPTRSFQSVSPGRGRVRRALFSPSVGSSAMFWDTMRHINSHYRKDGGFTLWFEADMVPLCTDWLDRLHAEWLQDEYVILGKLVDRQWVAQHNRSWLSRYVEHINGSACYCKDFGGRFAADLVSPRWPWDFQIFRHIKASSRYRASDLIDLRYRERTLSALPDRRAVLLHGVKDRSAREYVRFQLSSTPAKYRFRAAV